MGTVLRRTNQLPEAEACLHQAIELNPKYAKAYNNLALMLENTYRLDEAITNLRRAVELEANDPGLFYNLGVMLKDFRQLDEAENCFQQALKPSPRFCRCRFCIGCRIFIMGTI